MLKFDEGGAFILNPTLAMVVGAVVGIVVGALAGVILRKKIAEGKIGSAETEAKRIMDEVGEDDNEVD